VWARGWSRRSGRKKPSHPSILSFARLKKPKVWRLIFIFTEGKAWSRPLVWMDYHDSLVGLGRHKGIVSQPLSQTTTVLKSAERSNTSDKW
jgi:hypothetical protein